MRDITLGFILMSIVILAYRVNSISRTQDEILINQQTIIHQNDSIIALYHERDTLVTLYIEHLSTCSFISREDVGTGYDGYFYNKHHRRTFGRN